MRIALLTMEFPPQCTPQSMRWVNLVREMARLRSDLQFSIITRALPAHYPCTLPEMSAGSLLPELASGNRIEVHRVNVPQGESPALGHSGRTSHLSGLIRPLFHSLSPLDSGFVTSLRTRKRVSHLVSDCDLLVSSGPPHSSHVWAAGCASSKPWIADLGDPLADAGDNRACFLTRCLQRSLENRLLASVSAAVFTSEATAGIFRRRCPVHTSKLFCIHQGVTPWVPPPACQSPAARPLQLIYAGSFYEKLREPLPLLDAVASLSDVRLDIFGSIKPDIARQIARHPAVLDGRVNLAGFLATEQLNAEIAGRHAMVFLSNRGSTQIPGKLFECLSSSKPVLAILQDSTRDASYPIIERFLEQGVHLATNDAASIAAAVKGINRQPFAAWNRDLSDHSWSKLAESYLEIIEAARS